MKLKYCPNCIGMDIFRNAHGVQQCARCKYTGDMKEGAIDEINAARKRIISDKKENTAPEQKPVITNKELKERLEKLKAKKSADFEFL
ncbi:MAG: hypothetical protein JW772_05675 [Candidatus Diapherotrites archaeon]|nr:hypothetical protein [Candidatus Diapherotrites archaeon]